MLSKEQLDYVAQMQTELEAKKKHTKPTVEKLAASFGITDKNLIKELTELAIVRLARSLAHQAGGVRERFDSIVDLYKTQVNLSHRTSQSILLQQYSTPAPIGFLMGVFCGVDTWKPYDKLAFEPSAGNGLLTIAGNPKNFVVNEIEQVRNSNLQTLGYLEVSQLDTSLDIATVANPRTQGFDAVITNPPFGTLDKAVSIEGFRIADLDHLMAIRALNCMKDSGKAAIIIGSNTRWDKLGRIQAGKNRIFFNYLYSRYHVLDVLQLDGASLYSRQGTSFDVRLILIDGRKAKPEGVAPLKKAEDIQLTTFDQLYERVMRFSGNRPLNVMDELEREARQLLEQWGRNIGCLEDTPIEGLGMPYVPASESCNTLEVDVPDSMGYETHAALHLIKQEIGGDVDEFVRQRLGYTSKIELCKALSAEQIDAVAMAIYNIEVRGQGMIIADQTGIGKGRQAAAIVRYGCMNGYKPIFLTEKPNLFSDIYRDLKAIGSHDLVPFIVNGRESKTDVKDEDGNIVYQAMPAPEQTGVFEARRLPSRYDYLMGTYSQFNSPDKKPLKPQFLSAIAMDNILILDEAHNSSGSSNTGTFMQEVVRKSKGVLYLSATFAKRADNMPVYALKTSMSDANMSSEDLVEAITKGGVALQEVLSAQLVSEGQLLRRERTYEGIEVNYITLDEKEEEHKAIADNITSILRDIIAFQTTRLTPEIEQMDEIAAAENKEIKKRGGTANAGVDNMPYFSKVFNVINQMLFSIKAESVAERAIMRLKEGKKPVIAFASTMGSFIEEMEDERGMPVTNGSVIDLDFARVLQKGLDGVFRYTVTNADGSKDFKSFDISDLNPEAQAEYNSINQRIRTISSGITISPIDVVKQKLAEAGYEVAEVTGRKFEVQLSKDRRTGMVSSRKRENTNDAFRRFNNNEADVLLINQSGSTGASAHAIATSKVPKEKVKQRVMIILQAELDINTEVQKRGRINRTGQLIKPIYDYVNSAIPAEKRLMMMLQKKLKSLDANTSSNQKQSDKILHVEDFLNKYGDKIVTEYLKENEEVNTLLGDPLDFEGENSSASVPEDAAHRVSGRVAVLSTKQQTEFYMEINQRYNDYVEYLKQVGEYDLEVEALNLETKTIKANIVKVGIGGRSVFGDDSILETVEANVLRKPFTKEELENLIEGELKGENARMVSDKQFQQYTFWAFEKHRKDIRENVAYYENLIKHIPSEKAIAQLPQVEKLAAILAREKELQDTCVKQSQKISERADNQTNYFKRIFEAFTIGNAMNFPVRSFDSDMHYNKSIFLGFQIDERRKNPYAPSNVKLRFAIASGLKYITIPASYTKDIDAILGASSHDPLLKTAREDWAELIKKSTKDRTIRYIVTGNILQAFTEYQGNLVSYTTHDGKTLKGVLMPEYWLPAKGGTEAMIIVPVGKAIRFITDMKPGDEITTTNHVSIQRTTSGYRLIVPGAKQTYGDIFLDRDLMELAKGGNFNKVSDRMMADFDESHKDKLVNILQEKHKLSVSLSPKEFAQIKDELAVRPARPKVVFPPAPKPDDETLILELEAEAVLVKLKLLNFNQAA